ncbi:MAG: PEGA domain-containing protein [Deltaproteobacteria bacterium]|nr:PEGA domain-containing protein [Deltaproteobacteria bacterium]
MGGFGSQAFLGCVHATGPAGPLLKPAVFVFIPDDVVENKEAFRKVWAETELAGEIDHVNVIAVMGLARLEEGYARVVEYADAESLRSVYRRAATLKKPMPANIAVALVADAAMGVHYAHELGESETGQPWVHGGVRPETLQISFAGMAKVTGYGAQVLAESMRKKGQTGLITRDTYGAPEQTFGGRASATVQSDVYALGCVLYEALTGKAPFSGDKDLAEAMIKDELSRPGLNGVTEAMGEVVLKATQKRSSERYGTALELRMDLFERCEPANEQDVKRYLDELFPPNAVPRATRIQMLKVAQKTPPTPTGKLLVTMPAEIEVQHKERSAIPDDAEIESKVGLKVDDLPMLDDALVEDAHSEASASALVQRTLDRPGPAPSWSAAHTTPPSPHSQADEETDDRRQAPRGTPAPGPPRTAPSSSAAPAPAQPRAKLAPLPMPPQQLAPQVVYKTPAGLLVGIGLFGGVALALILVLVMKQPTPPPPTPVAPVAVIPTPPPPPPVPIEPPLQPLLPTTPSTPTTPTAPVAKGPGKIVITSEPALALTVDGKDQGKGSATVEVPAGKHTVVGKGAGTSLKRVVTVKAGGTEHVNLVVQKGALAIEAPAGCDVFIDGARVGKTPMDPISLVQGSHSVVVKQGAVEYRRSVPIQPNQEMFLQVQFHTN